MRSYYVSFVHCGKPSSVRVMAASPSQAVADARGLLALSGVAGAAGLDMVATDTGPAGARPCPGVRNVLSRCAPSFN